MKIILPIFYVFLLFLFLGIEGSMAQAQKLNEKELIRDVRETKNVNQKILRMILLGEYYSVNNLKKANDLRKKINAIVKQEGLQQTVEVDLFSAKIFKLQRQVVSFKQSVLPYEKVDLTNYSKAHQYEILQNIGYHYLAENISDTAKMYFNRSLAIAEKIKDYSGICRNNCYLSFNEMQQYKKEAALNYCNRALDAANKSKQKIDFAFVYLFQSFIYNYFSQPDIALSKELLAYSYAKRAENFPIMTIVSLQIGDKQVDIENYKEALYYFEIALKLATELEDLRLQGVTLSAQANVKRILYKLDEALVLISKSIATLKKVGNKYELGKAELNFARIYIDKKDYREALVHLNNALNYQKTKEIFRYKGIVYKKRNELNNALYYLILSIDSNDVNSLLDKSFEVYPMIAEIYEAQGKSKEALKYLGEFVRLSQKSKGNLAARRIAELNELYRSEQRDELIQQQNNTLEKQKQERELSKTKLENISLRNNMQTYIIIGFIVFVILATIIFIYRNRQVAIQQKRKEVEMSQALLRTQMNPHFIFNAMSVIQSYIFENDVENSSRFLVNFSRLIRLILENSPKNFITLETEIEILQKYLETQILRFEDRFDFEIICPDELLFDNVQIPPMITQPFVENSIEHGQLHSVPNGKITITFSKKKDMLQVSIEDNGIGRTKSEELKISTEHKSMALQITRNRISIINEKYNAAGYLLISDLDNKHKTGTKVLISLPYITEQISAN